MHKINKMAEEKYGFWTTILSTIKEHKKSLIIYSLILLVIYSFLYGIWKIPIIDFGINRTSEISILDYLFIFIVTILSSLFIALFRYEKYHNLASNSTAGISGVGTAGIISTACPACQSIGLVGFGSTFLNIPTAFLTPYLGILKIFTIGLLSLGIFLKADSLYYKTCKTCNIKNKILKKNIAE